MKLKAIQNTFHKTLEAVYENEEINNFFFLLLESYYNVSRLKLALEPELVIENTKLIENALDLLKAEKPIQYILGETEFYGLTFSVNEHVLIPRPETEELVDWIITELEGKGAAFKILDIGTGSGCIPVSLVNNLSSAKVSGLDVSKEALKVAKQNAERHNVDVTFLETDILKWKTTLQNSKFDIIVSNPPYVREQEKELMKLNVLDNEPHLALFVEDNNPLLFYKTICEFAKQNLKEGGLLFFEINEYLGQEMMKLLDDFGFKNIELKQDIFKKDRMIKASIINEQY